MRALIVDDNESNRRIMELFLRDHAECVAASNGTEAVETYLKAIKEGSPFDVIYLDMVMPDLSGIEVLTTIRKHETDNSFPEAVPVIMLTGEADVSRMNIARSLGIVEYLMKPVMESRLLEGLEKLGLLNNPNSW